MRQTLFRIWLEQPWSGWTTGPDGHAYFGVVWVWLILGAVVMAYGRLRPRDEVGRDPVSWGIWLAAFPILIFAGPKLPMDYLPVFGYGAMVLLGFLSGLLFAQHRARQVGMDPDLFMDLSFWILLTGVAGGRLAFLAQYGKKVFAQAKTLPEMLFAAVNLSEGGLVLIGALVGGTLGFFAFCHLRKLHALSLADVITPSVFIGIGFGRLGCLLNGCCFGDRCELPWGIVFPAGTSTFDTLVYRGFVEPTAAGTFPLHPTQIYSSINGFILAVVTAHYYWHRRYVGDVFALGLILYPIARILLEFLRADEMGQLGTGFTISQLYCFVILLIGIALATRLRMKVTISPQLAAD